MHTREWIEIEGKYWRTVTAGQLRKILKRRKGECTWCGQSVPKGRFTWCGDKCVTEFRGIQPDILAAQVKKRDKVCQICGKGGEEVDHIIPVCEGGGLCGADNLRLLCCDCHKKQTKLLMEKRRHGKSDTEQNGN
jgi:5-methylcytosine-specific restriction endonuclease McrA